jgi:hypothetical protein
MSVAAKIAMLRRALIALNGGKELEAEHVRAITVRWTVAWPLTNTPQIHVETRKEDIGEPQDPTARRNGKFDARRC